MAFFYFRYPELCNIYYGDYYSILTNYLYVTEDYSTIRQYFIQTSLDVGRSDLAKTCITSVLDSVSKGYLTISDNDMGDLTSLLSKI
jgi:hypothetical protein